MKKVIGIILALTVLATLPCVVAKATDESREAELGTTEEQPSMFQSALDYAAENDFDIFKENMLTGSYQLDTSAFYEMLKEIEGTNFNVLQWEVPTADGNIAALNLKFELLQADIKNLGYGEQYELSIPQLNNGYSRNITELFAAEFGDLSYKFPEHTLPDGINMSAIMQNSIANRDAMMKEFTESNSFAVIKSNHSIGDIFSAAQQILNKDTRPVVDGSDLTGKLEQLAEGMRESWQATADAGFADVKTQYETYLSAMGAGYKISHEAEDAFDKLVTNNRDKLSEIDMDSVISSANEVNDNMRN